MCPPCFFFRGRIIQDLPKLRQLDGEDVTRVERQEAGYVVSDEEEDGEDEEEDEEEEEDNWRLGKNPPSVGRGHPLLLDINGMTV